MVPGFFNSQLSSSKQQQHCVGGLGHRFMIAASPERRAASFSYTLHGIFMGRPVFKDVMSSEITFGRLSPDS